MSEISRLYNVFDERGAHGSYTTATAAYNNLPRGYGGLIITRGAQEVQPSIPLTSQGLLDPEAAMDAAYDALVAQIRLLASFPIAAVARLF